jgi:hypothetical protein
MRVAGSVRDDRHKGGGPGGAVRPPRRPTANRDEDAANAKATRAEQAKQLPHSARDSAYSTRAATSDGCRDRVERRCTCACCRACAPTPHIHRHTSPHIHRPSRDTDPLKSTPTRRTPRTARTQEISPLCKPPPSYQAACIASHAGGHRQTVQHPRRHPQHQSARCAQPGGTPRHVGRRATAVAPVRAPFRPPSACPP